mgnify:CR=1 FL=1
MQVTHFHRKPHPGNFSIETLFRDLRLEMTKGLSVAVAECPRLSQGLLPRVKNVLWARRHQSQVNHVTGDVTYLAVGMKGCKTVITIHDCCNLERLTGWKRAILKFFWFDWPIHRARVVTVISEATKNRLLELTNCPPEKLRVIYNPISPLLQPKPNPFNQDCPTVLHIGTKPNKNLERHAEALAGMRCKLRVIGRMTPAQVALLEELKIDFENVYDLPFEDIVKEYENCDLLLFASTYEGFGMPIAEANAVGRPVITSKTWSMPEVANGAAILVDPENVSEIRQAMERCIQDDSLRQNLVEKGFENAKRFNAANIARQYEAIYRTLSEPNG